MIPLALSLLGGAKRLLAAIPWQLYVALALAAAAWFAVDYHRDAVAEAAKVARAEGVTAENNRWVVVQQEAENRQLAKVLAITRRQQDIAQEASANYEEALDDIDRRARALSLRHDAALRERAAGGVNLPGTPAAPGEPVEAPAGDGLPWSAALPLMTQAAKDLAQLNAILDFYEKQEALANQQESSLAHPAAQ
jgi:hypothetical protein